MGALRYLAHASVAAGLGLAACAHPVYEGRYDYNEGWRVARVLALGDEASFGTRPRDWDEDCRGKLDSRTLEEASLALVRYRVSRGVRLRIAWVSPDHPVSPLDLVYVNVRDCRVPLAPAGRHVSPDG